MKTKSYLLFAISAILTIGVSACSGKQTMVEFYNYDGTLLWETPYKKNMELEYLGETPIRPSDEMYDYVFSNWNHSLDEVELYKTFYAQYESSLKQFTVTFKNYNNTTLKTVRVNYGDNALLYAPSNPTRTNTDRTHYYFEGWGDEDLTYVTCDMTVTAKYNEIDCYLITYFDDDGSLLHKEYVEEGKNGTYTYDNYFSNNDGDFYVFDKWDKNITNVKSDMSVYAQYKFSNGYYVTFNNYNGNQLYVDNVPEGYTATYKGSTPTKASTTSGNYKYTYTFSGWDKSLDNVTSDFTTTAQFSYTSTYYNANYENALQRIRNNAVNYDSDNGLYYQHFGTNITSTMTYTGLAEYDPSTDVVDLFYAAVSTKGIACGITIYFDNHKPGTYYITFISKYNGTTIATGMGQISGNWNSYSTISFSSFSYNVNYNKSDFIDIADSLVSICLSAARSTSWIDTYDLGFTNY